MRKILTISTVLLALAAAAGCGNDPDVAVGDSPAPTPSVVPFDSPEPSLTADPEPSFTLGDEQTNDSGGTVTVLGYEQPVAEDSPQPVEADYPAGHVWAGLDVKVCIPDTPPGDGYEGYYITTTVWKLAFTNGALLDSTHTGYVGFPEPQYPWGDTEVALGQCVRGWLVFAVPGDERPSGVHYTGGGGVLQWQLTEEG